MTIPTRSSGQLERLIGGSVPSVLAKLLLLSLIVGAVMWSLDIDPQGLFRALARFVESILGLGTEAVWRVLGWIFAGALVVVPLWLILRLFSRR